jgi:hypothetical protein
MSDVSHADEYARTIPPDPPSTMTRQEVEAQETAKQAQIDAAAQRQVAADKAEADRVKAEEAAKAQAEYEAQPKVQLQKVLTTLHANHFDVRDHLGVLTRALLAITTMMHAAAPEAEPLRVSEATEEEPDLTIAREAEVNAAIARGETPPANAGVRRVPGEPVPMQTNPNPSIWPRQ